MSDRSAPLPASMRVVDARDAYLAENGFSLEGYAAPRTKASLFGVEFSVPNPPHHARAIMRHDLHHVATGFGTDLVGEGEVSAFEARLGLRDLGVYVASLVLLGTMTGLAVAPRRTARAWRLARGCRTLFRDASYDELLAGTVGELRARMGLPGDGIAACARGLHSTAPDAARA